MVAHSATINCHLLFPCRSRLSSDWGGYLCRASNLASSQEEHGQSRQAILVGDASAVHSALFDHMSWSRNSSIASPRLHFEAAFEKPPRWLPFSLSTDFRFGSWLCKNAFADGLPAVSSGQDIPGLFEKPRVNHADCRVSSGPACEVRVLSTTSRSGGWTWLGATMTLRQGPDRRSCSSAWMGIGASREAKKSLPRPVMHQPRSSLSTKALAKISSFGTRAASRRIRSVQSDPLDIRMLT
jgi:hypothetical protein